MSKKLHKTYLRKMAIELIAYMKQYLNGKRKIKEYLLEFLAENLVEIYQDEWWDFIQDVIMDGYEGKGLNKMTLEELAEEYIEYILGSLINKKNYEMSFDEVKNHVDNLFGEGDDNPSYPGGSGTVY